MGRIILSQNDFVEEVNWLLESRVVKHETVCDRWRLSQENYPWHPAESIKTWNLWHHKTLHHSCYDDENITLLFVWLTSHYQCTYHVLGPVPKLQMTSSALGLIKSLCTPSHLLNTFLTSDYSIQWVSRNLSTHCIESVTQQPDSFTCQENGLVLSTFRKYFYI